MNTIIACVFGLVFIYFAWYMVRDYATTKGTVWERLLAAGEDSATKLWARIVIVIDTVFGFLASAADQISPSLGDAIHQYAKPEWVAGITLGVMVLTLIARNRTLKP